MFDTQVVVTSRLEADSHSPLRILSGNAGKEDVRRFLQEISGLETPGDRNNADAVLQVSISANHRLYEDLRRENLMCEALEDLMKDVIEKRVEEKVSQAVKLNTEQVTEQTTERVTEQKDKEMTVKLFERGTSTDTIAELVGRSVDVIRQWVSPVSQV